MKISFQIVIVLFAIGWNSNAFAFFKELCLQEGLRYDELYYATNYYVGEKSCWSPEIGSNNCNLRAKGASYSHCRFLRSDGPRPMYHKQAGGKRQAWTMYQECCSSYSNGGTYYWDVPLILSRTDVAKITSELWKIIHSGNSSTSELIATNIATMIIGAMPKFGMPFSIAIAAEQVYADWLLRNAKSQLDVFMQVYNDPNTTSYQFFRLGQTFVWEFGFFHYSGLGRLQQVRPIGKAYLIGLY